MELIGAKLKKIRLEKGLTLEDIQKRTKIQLQLLKAIEEGSTASVNPVYLKSFIKLYCGCLEIDYREYLPDYRDPLALLKRNQAPPAPPKPAADTQPVSFIQSASVKMSQASAGNKMPAYVGVGIAVLFFVVVFLAGKMLSSRHAHGGAVGAQARQQSRSVKRPDTAGARKPSPAAAAVKPQMVIPTSGNTTGGVRLTILAREDCWVKVKADGKLLYYGILKKGRYDSWQAKERIALNLGNAGVVDLSVNGQVISSVGRKGQVINDISITKAGLSVP